METLLNDFQVYFHWEKEFKIHLLHKNFSISFCFSVLNGPTLTHFRFPLFLAATALSSSYQHCSETRMWTSSIACRLGMDSRHPRPEWVESRFSRETESIKGTYCNWSKWVWSSTGRTCQSETQNIGWSSRPVTACFKGSGRSPEDYTSG